MKVYGIFRNGADPGRYVIRIGWTAGTDGPLVTVDYGEFSWTYGQQDLGVTLFKDLDSADYALENLKAQDYGGNYV